MAMGAEITAVVQSFRDNTAVINTDLGAVTPRKVLYDRIVPETLGTFGSSFEDLTVPDLEETIEQIIARRQQGVPDVLSRRTAGYYPTDPTTLQTADKVLAERKAQLESAIEQGKKQIEATKLAAEKAEKQRIKEQEAFEEYKAQQADMRSKK